MSKNWLRHFELQMMDKAGKGISLRDFKVTFDIEWVGTKPTYRVALVTIYNLMASTTHNILMGHFTRIRLIAGYDGLTPSTNDGSPIQAGANNSAGEITEISPDQMGQLSGANYGVIYDGEIRFSIAGKDNHNITDSWIQIQALSGHQALLSAKVKKTLAAGYTPADQHKLVMQILKPYGIEQGATGEMPLIHFPRGITLYHTVPDALDDIAVMCKASWQLVDRMLELIPEDRYIQESVVVLNSDTGLVGFPQRTLNGGINVRCLINANIRVYGLIHIDQTSIYRQAMTMESVKKDADKLGNAVEIPPSAISTDGVYIVNSINYLGDTRGQDWYMDLVCQPRGEAKPLNASTSAKN